MIAESKQSNTIAESMDAMGAGARRVAAALALTSNDDRNRALRAAATAIRKRCGEILAANATDMTEGKERVAKRGQVIRSLKMRQHVLVNTELMRCYPADRKERHP